MVATRRTFVIQEECPICNELTGRTFEHDDKEYAHVKSSILFLGACPDC